MKYCAFGCTLESDEPLPELPPAPGSPAPRWRVFWHDSIRWPAALRWRTLWAAARADGGVAVARAAGTCFLRFDGLATAAIGRGRIALAPVHSADPEAVRHALLDQILPLALAAAGETVLHASAVAAGGAALLFAGGAGSGKSTLAAALSAGGAEVLADDGVLLERRGEAVWAVPSYRGLRLWPDAAAGTVVRGFSMAARPRRAAAIEKYRLVPRDAVICAPALPVAAVYTLHPGSGAPAFSRLTRRDTALELVRHAYTPEPAGRAGVVAHLDRAVSWSEGLDVWRLDAPRDLTSLPGLAAAVLAHAGARGASARLQTR